MTRKEIESLPPGSELNRLIGETFKLRKEFECPKCQGTCFVCDYHDNTLTCRGHVEGYSESGGCGWEGTWKDVPWQDFSGDIKLAWDLVEELSVGGLAFEVVYRGRDYPDEKAPKYFASVLDLKSNNWIVEREGVTASHAICLAALDLVDFIRPGPESAIS